MPFEGLVQPEMISLDATYFLAKMALDQFLLPADAVPDATTLASYTALAQRGELYTLFARNGANSPDHIGELYLGNEEFHVEIAPAFRQRHLATRATKAILSRASLLGFSTLVTRTIAPENTAAQAFLTSLGFVPLPATADGTCYRLDLMQYRLHFSGLD